MLGRNKTWRVDTGFVISGMKPEIRGLNKSLKGDISLSEGIHSAEEMMVGSFHSGRTSLPSIGSTPELTTPRRARNIGFDAYIKHDVLKGSGFSTKLLKLDMLRLASAYPSPSEALNSCRSNRRLHRSVQTVGVVGLPPPQLEELHFAAEHMKRHWLLDFRRLGGNGGGRSIGSGAGQRGGQCRLDRGEAAGHAASAR